MTTHLRRSAATARSLAALLITILITAVLAVPATHAQDEAADEVRLRADRVTIEVDDDGRILLDGEPVRERDGVVVLRVEPGDDEVEVHVIGPRKRRAVVRGTPHTVHDRVAFRMDGKQHPFLFEDFDIDIDVPDMPDVAPLLERFRFDVGDSFRTSFEEHREVSGLERESRMLARRARSADGDERRELEAELRDQLDEIFDKKEQIRRDRIADLEEKVASEREALQRRRAAREDIIDRRLQTLMGEDDILDW